MQFIADHRRDLDSLTTLCERYRISRKTGYKWIARYNAEGPAGLHERSRRPGRCPHVTSSAVVKALLETRRHHPTWGAKKLLAILARRHPDWAWPARSTTCDLLRRHGLVAARRRRTWNVFFGPLHLGRLNERNYRIVGAEVDANVGAMALGPLVGYRSNRGVEQEGRVRLGRRFSAGRGTP